MSFAIQRLNEGIRATLLSHFLALPMKDRCLRFGTALAPAVIAGYVNGIDFVRGAVFGVRDDRLALVGVAHMAIENDVAEVALSVLPMHRGRGVGSALFKRAVAHARKRCIPRLFMLFRLENAPIMRIAQRFGMRIVAGGGEARAHLKLQPASLSSIAVEANEAVAFMPGVVGQPTGDSVAPRIDTHWSRMLHYDLSNGEVEPRARHALAANGFGDAASTDTASSPRLAASIQPRQTARAHRSRTLGKLIVAAIRAAAASVRRAHARYRQRREIDAICDSLRQLDDRTLRDLGFHRGELGSIAAELTRGAEGTRVRTSRSFPNAGSSVTAHEIANPTIDPQKQNKEITMPRHETSPPRVAFGIAAVAMTVITAGVLVVIPAKVEADDHDPGGLAASKVAAPASTSAVAGATIDVVSLHVAELATALCKPSIANCTSNTSLHPRQ